MVTQGFNPRAAVARASTTAVEKKYIDQRIEVNDLVDSWYLWCLNGVATGDSYDTRDGRKIVVKSVQLRGTVQNTDNVVLQRKNRMILFMDKQNNSVDSSGNGAPATAEMTSLLQDAGQVNSMLNPTTAGRFQILKDWSFTLGLNDGTTGYCQNPTWKDIKLYKKLNIPVLYSNTTNSPASINDKAIYLAFYNNVSSAGTGSAIRMDMRTRFLDV